MTSLATTLAPGLTTMVLDQTKLLAALILIRFNAFFLKIAKDVDFKANFVDDLCALIIFLNLFSQYLCVH